jgi:hypothetical protein
MYRCLLLLFIALAIACGSSSSPSSSAVSTASELEKVTISGNLDFVTGLSKARFATTLGNGNVQLTNIASGNITEATVSGTSFTAEVDSGDYIISARSSTGQYLRKILPSVSKTNKKAGNVDFSSTSVAEIVEQRISDDSSLTSLSALAASSALTSVVVDTETSLNENPGDYMLLQQELKQSISNGEDITDITFRFSSNVQEELKHSSLFTTALPNLFKNEYAVLTTVASDYSAGSYSTIDTSTFATNATIKSYATSDLAVSTFGKNIYILGRHNSDTLDRYDVNNPSLNLFPSSYSTLSSSETATKNPHSIILQGTLKAYVIRYGSNKMWIVNPSASSSSDFYKSELDLSAYDDGDGSAEISQGVIVGSKLFLGAQRLTSFSPTNTSYVVAVDTNTETEISTGKGEGSLNGIALPARNPNKIIYAKSTGLIYVQCTGAYASFSSGAARQYTGGIVTIDPTTYETKLLIDDGETASTDGTYGGLVSNMAICSATKGYLLIYKSWGSTALRPFNPTTGEVSAELSSFTSVDIRGISCDSQGRLWVSASTGVTVINSSDNSVVKENIDVGLLPNSTVEFIRF